MLRETVTSSCGYISSPNGIYCAPDAGLFWDGNLLDWMYVTHGPFAATTFIAHEWGHLLQDYTGQLSGGSNKALELQADCLAGFFAGTEVSLGLANEFDLQGSRDLFCTIGDPYASPWFATGAHGTCTERVNAFDWDVANAQQCMGHLCSEDPVERAVATCVTGVPCDAATAMSVTPPAAMFDVADGDEVSACVLHAAP